MLEEAGLPFSLLEATWSHASCQQEIQGMQSPVARANRALLRDAQESVPVKA